MSSTIPKLIFALALICSYLLLTAPLAQAAATGPAMPWDAPLTTVLNSLTGTVAHILITAAIVFTGFFFAFTESGTGARRVFGVALGGALALGAVTFMTAVGWAGATM